MEVISRNEAFTERDGDWVFTNTKVILQKRGQYYYALTQDRLTDPLDVPGLSPIPIPSSEIWPTYPANFTRAPDPPPQGCYVKGPNLIHYEDAASAQEIRDLLLREAEVCEVLRQHPHRNIAQYLGCQVRGNSITGLCFARYDVTLSEWVKQSRPSERIHLCLKGIEEGVQHLHSLGLIHCDLNPYNIMMDGDNPRIIDFDSCKRIGERLGESWGTMGWAKEGLEFATPEADHYGLAMIRELLLNGNV